MNEEERKEMEKVIWRHERRETVRKHPKEVPMPKYFRTHKIFEPGREFTSPTAERVYRKWMREKMEVEEEFWEEQPSLILDDFF